MASENLRLTQRSKRYLQAATFKPVFQVDIHHQLSQQADGMFEAKSAPPVTTMRKPMYYNPETVARICQAIYSNREIDFTYYSERGLQSAQRICPHAIFDDGFEWFVRAYSCADKAFINCMLTRITEVIILPNSCNESALKEHDRDWRDKVNVRLVPHPKSLGSSKRVEAEYGMKDGVLIIQERAATLGYLLKYWKVDCSTDASLNPDAFPLYLNNRSALAAYSSMDIAPRFTENK
jgi:predicted DNA-binding transcriptional regulator YafY